MKSIFLRVVWIVLSAWLVVTYGFHLMPGVTFTGSGAGALLAVLAEKYLFTLCVLATLAGTGFLVLRIWLVKNAQSAKDNAAELGFAFVREFLRNTAIWNRQAAMAVPLVFAKLWLQSMLKWNRNRAIDFLVSFGWLRTFLVVFVVRTLVHAALWKLTSCMFMSLAFAGFLPAIYAAFAIAAVGSLPLLLRPPNRSGTWGERVKKLFELVGVSDTQPDLPRITDETLTHRVDPE